MSDTPQPNPNATSLEAREAAAMKNYSDCMNSVGWTGFLIGVLGGTVLGVYKRSHFPVIAGGVGGMSLDYLETSNRCADLEKFLDGIKKEGMLKKLAEERKFLMAELEARERDRTGRS